MIPLSPQQPSFCSSPSSALERLAQGEGKAGSTPVPENPPCPYTHIHITHTHTHTCGITLALSFSQVTWDGAPSLFPIRILEGTCSEDISALPLQKQQTLSWRHPASFQSV